MERRPSLIDRAVLGADRLLRTASGVTSPPPRQTPSAPADAPPDRAAVSRPVPGPPAEPLAAPDRIRSLRLMRVNHAGEVAAQALYQGQAAVARDPRTRAALLAAGREERDHLVWCQVRLRELGGGVSVLSPLWYVGSLAIGAAAGLAGDRWSLGFVAETERQVERHLTEHLARLPAEDHRSREILAQMQADERRHGQEALDAGGERLPAPVQQLMTQVSHVMTRTAYWL